MNATSQAELSKSDDGPIYLIDGSGYIFRAYYATPPLTNKEGFPTNAIYAFTRMLLKLLTEASSNHVVMVFDAGKETFRNELYSEYKANRDECPEDLSKQMPYFRTLSQAIGLPPLELKGYEADDVIGTLVRRCKEAGRKVVIVSADKDLMQLVTEDVTIWDTMRDKRYGPAEVQEKMGVPPEKVIELLALTGDSSDNVPGMKGVGPKTATQLIEKFGDVESILSSADAIAEEKSIRSRKKICEQIECSAELVRLSKELVTVHTEVPLKVRSGDEEVEVSTLSNDNLIPLLTRNGVDDRLLQELIDELDFHSLASDFQKISPEDVSSGPIKGAQYHTVLKDDFESFCEAFLKTDEFCFDVETTDLNPREAELVGIALCWSETEAYYVPFSHKESGGLFADGNQVALSDFIKACGQHFADTSVTKIAQNIKFDVEILVEQGITVRGTFFDTMLAAYLLHPEGGNYGLDALAREHLGHVMIPYSSIVPKGADFSVVPVDEATQYAAEDAHATWLLLEVFTKKLSDENLLDVFKNIEIPLVPVLVDMELRGIKLDTGYLKGLSEQLAGQLEKLQAKLFEISGEEFNQNSPKQLSEILFEKLGIPTKGVKKTKTGFSTNQAVLEKLRNEHPIIEHILEYRALHKLKSTYVDALPAQVSPTTGRLHSSFNQTVTATGRLSSSNPNLQNIPIQNESGRRVRKAFIAEQGSMLLSADYSQIELRILAHMSGDKTLIESFQKNEDIHEKTAREILSIPDSQPVESHDRRIGKTINFGIVYGMSGFRLARDLGIPVGVATEYIDNYFDRYPGVKKFFSGLEKQMDDVGYVETLYGRKRYVSQIDTSGRDAGFMRRAALNAPLQGTAADIIKLAMIRVADQILSKRDDIHLLLQIHDELVFEVKADALETCLQEVQQVMEAVDESLSVPLKVDISHGANWDEAH